MAEYRKKPVIINATRWDGTARDAGRIIDWLSEKHPKSLTPSFFEINETEHRQHAELRIPTMEGVMTAKPTDFIIVGVQGEIYPCDAAIFAETYEEVTRG